MTREPNLRGRLDGGRERQWMEVASAVHGGGDLVFHRPFDPRGKTWEQHSSDSLLHRQFIWMTGQSKAAAGRAGFRTNNPNKIEDWDLFYCQKIQKCRIQKCR